MRQRATAIVIRDGKVLLVKDKGHSKKFQFIVMLKIYSKPLTLTTGRMGIRNA